MFSIKLRTSGALQALVAVEIEFRVSFLLTQRLIEKFSHIHFVGSGLRLLFLHLLS